MTLVQDAIAGKEHKEGVKALALRILHAQPSHGNGRNYHAHAFKMGYEAARTHFLKIADAMIQGETKDE